MNSSEPPVSIRGTRQESMSPTRANIVQQPSEEELLAQAVRDASEMLHLGISHRSRCDGRKEHRYPPDKLSKAGRDWRDNSIGVQSLQEKMVWLGTADSAEHSSNVLLD